MAEQPRVWPEEYGVVFALGMCSGEIKGKVKLNKALALLQRDGFPIRNKFKNAPMGPHDAKIDTTAQEMEKDHLISIKEEPTTYDKNRISYRLKREGQTYLEDDFREQFAFANNQPFSLALLENFKKTQNNVLTLKTTKLVEQVHEELGLDNEGNLRHDIGQVRGALGQESFIAEKGVDPSCPICLEVLGSLDFAMRSLDAMLESEKRWFTTGWQDSGKSFILFSALRLIDYSKEFRRHQHNLDVRLNKDDSISLMRSRVLLRLHCIEYNGVLYDLIHPFQITDDEIESCDELRA